MGIRAMRIDGNSILASDGGTPIQWDVSDNVTIGGDITIGGNCVKILRSTKVACERNAGLLLHKTRMFRNLFRQSIGPGVLPAHGRSRRLTVSFPPEEEC